MSVDVADAFEPGGWEFTPAVVEEFDKHVRQSVPYYDAIQETVAEVADWLAPDGSTIVDLGASTGTTLAAIARRQPQRTYRYYLYDASGPMLKAAAEKLCALGIEDANYVTGPLGHGFGHRAANLTLALFTLQFLSPFERETTLGTARVASAPDGAILVAEKVRPADSRWAEIAAEVSWDWKAEHGIGSESIRTKARALRGVLRTQTDAANLAELTAAGWKAPTVLFRWHQWSLYGAFAT